VFQVFWLSWASNAAGRNAFLEIVASPNLDHDRIDSTRALARRLEWRQLWRFGVIPQVPHEVLQQTCGCEERKTLISLCAIDMQHLCFPGQAFEKMVNKYCVQVM